MDGLRHKKLAGTKRVTRGRTTETGNADGVNSERNCDDLVSSKRARIADVNSKRSRADLVRSKRAHTDGVNPEKNGADASSERVSIDGINSERRHAATVNSENVGTDGSQMSNGGDNSNQGVDNSNQGGSGSSEIGNEMAQGDQMAQDDPPKRGRGQMSRTKLRLPPRGRQVELKPKGHSQFTYANYVPKGFKYASQVGAILKREYPGVMKVYDDEGNIIKRYPAYSWSDYCMKKDGRGFTYAQRVKAEFWRLYTVQPSLRRKAASNLENYLVKRVSDMMSQARVDSVKKHCFKKGEKCTDARARAMELSAPQYFDAWLEWCNKRAWALLSHYWTTDEFKKKRLAGQTSRMSCEDAAQNRGGSRNFAETQQFLDLTFGPEKASTINTYAVMKSGMKNVDNTGRAGPIPSKKAQQRVDDYKAGCNDENSQELDPELLYKIGRGLPHGRVPIGDGAVDKEEVKAAAKSANLRPTNSESIRIVIQENEHLKDTNNQLKKTNDILTEENSVNRELIMRLYADFGKDAPADLLGRLSDIDARRSQVTESPHASHSADDDNPNDDSDADIPSGNNFSDDSDVGGGSDDDHEGSEGMEMD